MDLNTSGDSTFRDFFEQAAIGMGRVRFSDARWMDVNAAFCQMLGRTKEELLSFSWTSLTHPDDIEIDLSQFRKMAAGELERYTVEKRFLHKDGHVVWARLTLSLVRDASGKPDYEVAVIEDIHEQKIAQEELKKAQERFDIATLSSSVGVWEYDIETDTAWRSLSHDYLHGYDSPLKDWDVETALKHIHPEDKELFRNTLRKSIRTKTDFKVDYRLVLPDKSQKWVVARGHFLNDKLIGTTIDITPRKKAELAVKEKEKVAENARQELHDLFMQTPTGLALMEGPEHRFVLVNQRYLETSGRNPTGKTVKEAFSPEEAGNFIQLLDIVFRTGVPYIGAEVPFTRKNTDGDSEILFLNIYYYPFRTAEGVIKGVLAYIQDVTELVRARKVIEKSEAGFRTLANALPQIIWTATPEFHVDWYNDWWYNYIGHPRGTEWDDVEKLPMHPDDVILTRQKVIESQATGKDFNMEQRFKRASDGQYRWHLVRGVPVKDETGKIVKWVGANTDIHDQKMIVKKLHEERELRERFVSTLSHDLRTPLTAAKMSAQMLARQMTDNPKLFATAHKISGNMDRADRMIRDLLDASYISAGQTLPLKLVPVDLQKLATEIIEELTTVHGDRFEFAVSEKIEGQWDRDALKRIFENLLSNAIKYGSKTHPIQITLKDEEECARIEVHNEGNPISPEDQKRLFEQYRRADSAKSGEQRGWGLGLTLVKGLAEAHRGSIRVESSKEMGTTFIVRLPKKGL